MACHKATDEILVCNNVFKYKLVKVNNDVYDLVVTPCCTPTAVYDVARISERMNGCMQSTYYQAFINTDPVVIIQDCTLEGAVRRAIAIYFENNPCIECTGCNDTCCNQGLF